MRYTPAEVLEYVKNNDVKFVKLTFCDLFGRQKNLSIVAGRLEGAFTSGVALCGKGIAGFAHVKEDLRLYPDPDTLTILPWRPQSGRVVSMFCHVCDGKGNSYSGDGLAFLERAVKRLNDSNLTLTVGTDCEFYIMKRGDDGEPTLEPYDRATYCDASPVDRCENVRRDIVFSLENMGFMPTGSHHEVGPGQNEIDFCHADPLTAAKHLLLFRSAVKNVCNRDGLFATFMPKPLAHEAGSGLDIKLQLNAPESAAGAFTEGILRRLPEIMPFACATPSSYKRDLPTVVGWTNYGFDVPVKVAATDKGFEICLHLADCVTNPFVLLGLIIHAGLDGVKSKRVLRAVFDYAGEGEKLPRSLSEAVAIGCKSAWLMGLLGQDAADEYFAFKRAETEERVGDASANELRRYLDF